MLKNNGNDLPILLDCGLINDVVSTTQDNHRQKGREQFWCLVTYSISWYDILKSGTKLGTSSTVSFDNSP
jgi:hypothetical protein